MLSISISKKAAKLSAIYRYIYLRCPLGPSLLIIVSTWQFSSTVANFPVQLNDRYLKLGILPYIKPGLPTGRSPGKFHMLTVSISKKSAKLSAIYRNIYSRCPLGPFLLITVSTWKFSSTDANFPVQLNDRYLKLEILPYIKPGLPTGRSPDKFHMLTVSIGQ